ncbi:MAG: phenylacetate--CoA ligase family protein [Candidatus Freyarchaeota archaeon]
MRVIDKVKEMLRDRDVTPEKVRKFIEMVPVYREDKKDPAFLPRRELDEVRNRNLRTQVELCAKYSPYYREVFRECGIDASTIRTIDDLERLPLTTKMDYMKDPEAFRLRLDPSRPFYELILWDLTMTTGTTTGVPSIFYNTTHDFYTQTLFFIRSSKITWAVPGEDITFNAFPLGPIPHMAYIRTITASLAAGCAVVAGHTGMPHPDFPIHRRLDDAIRLMEAYRCTGALGIASYMRRFVMRAQELGVDFSSVRGIHALGEPCPKGMRDDMVGRLEKLGADAPTIGNAYGFTECQGAFPECAELAGCHNSDPSLYFVEAVDPEMGERVAEGEEGHIAVTHLNRRGTVLLRYLLGDVGRITYEPCPHCGRVSERMIPISGSVYTTRTKELVKLKGTLINPGLLIDAIENIGGIMEYQVLFTKADPNDPYSLDKLVIRVYPTGEKPAEELREGIVDAVVRTAEMRPLIEFVSSPFEIFDPRTSLKATRILDMRPKLE